MKKISVLILAVLFSATSFANTNSSLPFFSFGLKAGFTTNQSKVDLSVLQSVSSIKSNASGFHVGGVARLDFPLLPIYVQGELLYDWGKYKSINMKDVSSFLPDIQKDITVNNFSVPVMVGVGIGSSNIVKIRANLGPVFNLVSTASIKDLENAADIEKAFTRPTVTWTAGIGIDLFNIMVDVRYNGVFSKKEIKNVGEGLASINTRPTSWTFSIGYLF